MTKSPRKSIVASFGLLSAELESESTEEHRQPDVLAVPSGSRVGAGVIGAAHRAIDDIRAERDRLRLLVEAGGLTVKELDPDVIDPSPFPDRLPDDNEVSFNAFRQSIAADGQKVPIQVRKHPSASNRYQVVYGHRRWLAAKALGVPVRAIEVEISDADLVVAQGIENASRQDLSWIERALFASHMDVAGIKARNIYAALAIDDAELSKMRAVYRAIPGDLIERIGRAPKIGRPRWLELAKGISNAPDALGKIRSILTLERDVVQTSDQRFQKALELLKRTPSGDKSAPIRLADGTVLGATKVSGKSFRFSATSDLGSEFIEFLERELPALAEQFSVEKG